MPLSEDQRRALQDRADGLRNEVSSLAAEHREALFVASDADHDAKLIAEVESLEKQRDEIAEQRDAVQGSVASAMEVMNAAAAEEQPAPQEPALVEPPVIKSNGLINGTANLGEGA